MTLAELYARIPEVHCRGLCQAYCGPVPMADLELEAALALRPDLRPLASPFPIGGNLIAPDPETLTCRCLVDGRCSVYAARPVICRLWGAVKRLRCPHGCTPENWLSPREAGKITNAVLGK